MISCCPRFVFLLFLGALVIPRRSHAFKMMPLLKASHRTGSAERITTVLKASKTPDAMMLWKIPILSLLLSVQLASPSLAAVDSIFNHEYSDPLHLLCHRRIQVLENDSTKFHYTGTAVGPKDDTVLRGCSKEEIRKYKLRRGEFYGDILPGNKISAGDGIHEGVRDLKYKYSVYFFVAAYFRFSHLLIA